MPEEAVTIIQNILVIDDDIAVGEFISVVAKGMGLPCTVTSDATSFLKNLTPDVTLIVLDLIMPQMDGIEILRLLGHRRCKAGIVLLSGVGRRVSDTAETFARGMGLSIVGNLQKPIALSKLEEVLSKQPEALPTATRKSQNIIQNAKLRSAIQHDQFVLHHQPQIDIATGEVVGVEGLIRWQYPGQELILPQEFIARAESLGLIDQLSWIVVNHGLSELGLLADSQGTLPNLSLNVSVRSLRDIRFPDILMGCLEKYNVPPEKLVLEITETGLVRELTSTLDVLIRLRLKGVQLSIDDFGTGYSGMQQIRHIPSTELKIDKSFVQNMHINNSDRVLVQKTIEIGHELGMKVVAEGVETTEQLDFLRVHGCDIAQGFLFSPALPAKEMADWLKQYRSR